MTKESFDLFCPKCNILVETEVIAKGSGGFRSDAANPIDEADSEYHGDIYYISLCARCKQAFILRQSLYGVPGEFETITDETLLYPSESKLPVEHLPPLARSAYEQALKSFSASLYEPCVLMCRKSLEVVCKTLNAKGSNLYGRLESLKENGHIDKRLLTWAHEIRAIGNEAAHDIDSEIRKEDARDSLDLTEAILIYIFSLTRRFESFRERRNESNKNQA